MPFNGVNGPTPSYVDYSTGRCAPDSQRSTVVPNPGAYPYGVGVLTPPAGAQPQQQQQPAAPPPAAPVASGIDASKQIFGAARAPVYGAPTQKIANQLQPEMPQQQQIQGQPRGISMEVALEDLNKRREQAKIVANIDDINAFMGMHDRTHERDLLLEWKFSLEEASASPGVLTKTISNPNVLRFSVKDPVTGVKSRIGDLKTGIILKMSVISAFSDAKPTLGLVIPGVAGRTYTANGRRYPFTLSYKQNLEFKNDGRTIHQISELINTRRLERFGHLTPEGVESTITYIQNRDYALVLKTSPIVHVIRINQDILRINLDAQPSADNDYMIGLNIVEAAKKLLKRDFFDRMPFLDLNSLSFTWERTDGQKIGDVAGFDTANSRTASVSNHFLTKQNTVRMLVRIHWMLPNVTSKQNRPQQQQLPVAAAAAAPIKTATM